MRFVCDSCRAQYMISDDKVGAKGVKVRCKKCGYVILVRRPESMPMPGSEAPASAMPAAMSNGTASVEGQSEELTRPGHDASPSSSARGFLEGVEDDEIGAVFDNVLSPGGAVARPSDAAPGPEASADGQELPREAAPAPQVLLDSPLQAPLQSFQAAPAQDENGASHEWFVAIDEKQVGPLAFDKVKDLWNRGEIGPDSLCWRAGLADWLTLAEVPDLATLLAPKPIKPVIVAAAPVTSAAPAPSAPVESAFSAGSSSRAARGVPASASGTQATADEPGGWKPSAASALASLMQEEIEVLARPAPAPKRANEPPPAAGLLDVPAPIANGRQGSTASAMTMAEDGAARSSPGSIGAHAPYPSLYGYAARTPSRRGLIIGLSISGGVLLLALAVVTTILVLRSGLPELGAKGAPKAQGAVATPASEREKGAPSTAPGQTTSGQAANAAPDGTSGQANPTPTSPSARSTEARTEGQTDTGKLDPGASATKVEPSGPSRPERTRRERIRPPRMGSNEEITVPRRAERSEAVAQAPHASSEDDFDREFGGAEKRKSSVPKSERPSRPTSVYVPPAPGAEIPESLGTAEIMQTVLANKPAIKKCVDEQKKRDSSLSGKIVMTWTILVSGKTTNISCASDDFKSSYMAQCMSAMIKTWQFPRHRVQGEPINFPFTF